jgi:hypothetical protein
MLAKLVRYHRSIDPHRTQAMCLTGLRCRCAECLCCRMNRFLRRLQRAKRDFDRKGFSL